MKNLRTIGVFSICLCIIITASVTDANQVTTVLPAPNTHSVVVSTDLAVTFDETLTGSTVNS